MATAATSSASASLSASGSVTTSASGAALSGTGGDPATSTIAGEASRRRDVSTPILESLVRGVVAISDLPQINALVSLLCPDSGHLGKFRDWERVYNVQPDMRAPRHSLRLRKHIANPPAPQLHSSWEQCSLMYYGPLDRRAPHPVERRPIQVVPVGKDAQQLVDSLGCVLVHEFIRQGVRYRTGADLTVEIYVIERLLTPGNPDATAGSAVANTTENSTGKFAIIDVFSEGAASPDELLTFMSYLTPKGVVLRQ